MKLKVLVLIVLAMLPTAVFADADVGRYQMVALPKVRPGEADRVMVLDTKEGVLWEWWEAPASGNYPGENGWAYLGKAVPMGAAGATEVFRRFNPWPTWQPAPGSEIKPGDQKATPKNSN